MLSTVVMNSDSGMSSGSEERYNDISSEEFVEMEPRICYDEYQGAELEFLVEKERELQFRKTLYKKTPTVLDRAREIYFHFLNRPSSSLLVCAPTASSRHFLTKQIGNHLVSVYIFTGFGLYCPVDCSLLAIIPK